LEDEEEDSSNKIDDEVMKTLSVAVDRVLFLFRSEQLRGTPHITSSMPPKANTSCLLVALPTPPAVGRGSPTLD
jgi:hypothetical protein